MTATLPTSSDLVSLVKRAALAPSSHNTQPWHFRITGATVDLFADPTRALPVNDPDDRELTISCGCALMNLRVAAAARGLDSEVTLLPRREESDWLARVRLEPRAAGAAADAALSEHIERRHTYRKRFRPAAVSEATIERLVAAAAAEGGWFHPVLEEPDRQRLAQLVAEGDTQQWANPSWRRELAAWMHPRRRGDGLTVSALAAPIAHAIVRTFDMGQGIAAKDRDLADASPLLAILGTERDEIRDWLLAGQALERVVLTACQSGLQASFLNQPVQVASLRPKLRDVAGRAVPQVLLRLGEPMDEPVAAPRRAVADIVEAPP
ncbi:MAG: nitroreductase [Acidobacteria bacterium RIFCSPLOWO2_02_FULL_65_29]|nr:MAG: nitroreductase [Acidobacteria bacterium RIFCSPLOWO2_02_FULL_65_29]